MKAAPKYFPDFPFTTIMPLNMLGIDGGSAGRNRVMEFLDEYFPNDWIGYFEHSTFVNMLGFKKEEDLALFLLMWSL